MRLSLVASPRLPCMWVASVRNACTSLPASIKSNFTSITSHHMLLPWRPPTLFPTPCLYPSPAQPFAHCLWSDSRQEHVVCCWLCCGFAISSETWMCVVPRQHGFHDSVSCQHVFHGFRVMPKVTLGCWLLPRILQVFSFSGNAMPDDISIMTMAGERTRSGPPKDVKQ